MSAAPVTSPVDRPWNVLWAMMVGFFMILVDSTIVAVANVVIMRKLGTDYDGVIWVTSAYLLAYAVPLLVAGRLGDRFGPRNLYLAGLAVFTLASLWCGLSGDIGMLIAARVVQGFGAALLTPQTLSTITRIFPPERRGAAMSLWGATAGVATLVGPLAGGVLVDHLGWQWIFFVNVPIGIVGLVLAWMLVPHLPTEQHRFDVPGVVLSGLGMFCIVFGLQEGQTHDWSWWIWLVIIAGLGFMAAFIRWQSVNPNEPLIPLSVFRDNDFCMSNVAVATIGFCVTAMILPVMFHAQAVLGFSATRSALLIAPMAVVSGMLAPIVGRLVDRYPPQPIVGFGFSALAVGLTWLSIGLTPDTPIWQLVLPFVLMGIGMAFIWAPLAATATRNLPPRLAGAGSGVYNATRQVGSVLGSAGMAAYLTARISAELPSGGRPPSAGESAVLTLPPFLHGPFAAAMSQALLLPAFGALFGIIAALFLRGQGSAAAPLVGPRAAHAPQSEPESLEPNYFPDDDDYVEYTVDRDDLDDYQSWEDWYSDTAEPATSPIPKHIEDVLSEPLPDDHWHSRSVDNLLGEAGAAPAPTHDVRHTAQAAAADTPAAPRRGRHYRDDDDEVEGEGEGEDPGVYGMHSMRFT